MYLASISSNFSFLSYQFLESTFCSNLQSTCKFAKSTTAISCSVCNLAASCWAAAKLQFGCKIAAKSLQMAAISLQYRCDIAANLLHCSNCSQFADFAATMQPFNDVIEVILQILQPQCSRAMTSQKSFCRYCSPIAARWLHFSCSCSRNAVVLQSICSQSQAICSLIAAILQHCSQ